MRASPPPRRLATWITALLLVCAGCAGSGSRGSAAGPAPGAAVGAPVRVNGPRPEPPATIAEWSVTMRDDDDDLDVGLQTRYGRADGLRVDTWVYPVVWPEAVCRVECLEVWVTREADEFRDLAPAQLLELGYFSAMELIGDDTLPPLGPDLTRTRHLAYAVTNAAGDEGRSDYILAAGHGYRLKVRLTDYEGLASETTARDVFAGYAHGMSWPYECPSGAPPETEAIHMESTTDVPVNRMAGIIDSVLAAGGHELKSRNGAFSTVASFDWPEETEPETWHGEVNPGYQLLVLLEPRQDSTAYAVEAHVVCDIGDPRGFEPGSVMSNLRIIAAVSLSARIAEAIEAEPR